MSKRHIWAPELRAGFWCWSFAGAHSQIIFVGKGPSRDRQMAFHQVVDNPQVGLSWPRQIHSAMVVAAHQEGLCGDADALTTAQRYRALSVATADCVPVVIEGQRHLATVHAGWRGLVGRIIPKVIEDLGEDPNDLRAWIGPAIGVCCYQVGPEVGSQVVGVSDPSVLQTMNPNHRPHLDLVGAAECQLLESGVEQIQALSVCTHCSPDWLWSYRRDQGEARRNWTFAWQE